jgi:hypothetical protein
MTETELVPSCHNDNVIPIRPKPSSEGWSRQEQEALTIAKLAALPQLEYERARDGAAKKLRCRVTWLDRIIRDIRSKATRYPAWMPNITGNYRVGDPVTVSGRRNGSLTLGFIVATMHSHSEDQLLVVLADGDATTVWATPFSSEEPSR